MDIPMTIVSNNMWIPQQNAYLFKYNTNKKYIWELGVKLCEEKEVNKRTEWDSYVLTSAL